MGNIIRYTFGLGVYGERALAIASAMVSRPGLRFTLTSDGEVSAICYGLGPDSATSMRQRLGMKLLRVSQAVLKRQAMEGKGEEVALGDGAMATPDELMCAAKAMMGRGRKGLVKAYGEGTVSRVMGSPADPVTSAAVEAILRQVEDVKARQRAETRRLCEDADQRMHRLESDHGQLIEEIERQMDQLARKAAELRESRDNGVRAIQDQLHDSIAEAEKAYDKEIACLEAKAHALRTGAGQAI